MILCTARPVLLFIVLLMNVGPAVAAVEEAKKAGGTECLDSFDSQANRCFETFENLAPNFKRPFNSVASWAASFDQHVCRRQLQQQAAEVYRCLFNTCRQCLDLLRADAAERGDYGKTFLLYDLEFYLPDPDLIEKALQLLCRIKDVALLCLDDEETRTHVQFCGVKESERVFALVDAADLKSILWNVDGLNLRWNKESAKPLLDMDRWKCTICMAVKGYQTCVVDYMRRCPQTTISFIDTLLGFLTPPSCQSDEMTKGNADQRKSSQVHDEM